MAVSRYRNIPTVEDGRSYGTMSFPSKADLDSIDNIRVRVSRATRLDILAFKYLGAGEYWWVIAVLNDLDSMFSATDGQVLKIPVDVQDVLKYF